MAYTTKSGKTFANPQMGKAYDDAEDSQDQETGKKPSSKLEPEAADDEKGPVIRIVIAQTPEGNFTSDDGKEQSAHDDLSALIDHLKGRFGGASDEPEADDAHAPAAPSGSIADSVAAMLGPQK